MATSIKITELADIGAAIAPSTLVPVVNMVGAPETEKANLQIVGNLILGGAGGGNFVQAARAGTAGTVTTAAQPNITSTGSLTGLTVSNASGIVNFSNTANVTLGAVGNLHIAGGTAGQLLSTNGNGTLSWASDATTYGNSNVVSLMAAFGSNTITTTGNVSVGNIIGNGQALTNIAGANISGFVPNANVANTAFAVAGANVSGFVPNANVANTAFAVAAANVSGLGNIATINLTGINSNVLYGNGVFAEVATGARIANGTSNVNIPASNGNVVITANGTANWTFDTTGTFTTPGNIAMDGQSLFVGTGADVLGFTSETLVVFHEGQQFVQGAIINAADTGSADWVAYGHNGSDAGGWADTGFTGISYNDPDFTITGPGDGYLFAEGFPDNTTGGNLVLATGYNGTTKDIIFATGGFALVNEFGRISNANNAFELNSNANITGANVISANYIGAGNLILSEGGTLTNNIPPVTFDILYQYDDLVWSGNTLTFTNASSTYMLGVLALMQVGDTITLGGTPTTVTGAYTGGGAGTFNVSGTGVGQQIGQFTLPNRLTSVNGIKLTTNSKNYLFTEAGVTQSPVLTVDTLPSGQYAVAGFRAFVSDANLAPVGNFGEIVGNSGSNTVCVWCDGTNWRIG
jgi:hypothetical protein